MAPTPAVRREPLPRGVAGVNLTRQRMVQLIRQGAGDPEVIAEARRIVWNVPPHDHTGEIGAVFDFLTSLEEPYRLDPVDRELLQGAGVSTWGRDCDCKVIKGGALLEALGHPVRVVIGAPRAPGVGREPAFRHTWLEVWDRNQRRWVSFDPVLHLMRPGLFARVGDVAPHAVLWRSPVRGYVYQAAGARVDGVVEGLDGFSLKKLAKGIGKVATSKVGGAILKKAVSLVPGGNYALTAIDVASKGVNVVKGLKKGGLKGAISAAAPIVLDKVAPGLGQKVRAVSASLPKELRDAAPLLKQVATRAAPPKVRAALMQRAAPVVRAAVARAAPPRPIRLTAAKAPPPKRAPAALSRTFASVAAPAMAAAAAVRAAPPSLAPVPALEEEAAEPFETTEAEELLTPDQEAQAQEDAESYAPGEEDTGADMSMGEED